MNNSQLFDVYTQGTDQTHGWDDLLYEVPTSPCLKGDRRVYYGTFYLGGLLDYTINIYFRLELLYNYR